MKQSLRVQLAIIGATLSGLAGHAPAEPANPLDPWQAASQRPVLLVGHGDLLFAPAVRRFRGIVTALGALDEQGHLYSFDTTTVEGPIAANEVRSWRVTILSGELLGSVFQVKSNTPTTITITTPYGPLNGLVEGDLFLVEEIPPPPPPRTPPAPAGT
jgi:hypothetical protein